MITTIHGDLLDFPDGINIIAHSCNCQNIMGGGIAAQIKQRYPEAFNADTMAAKVGKNTLGHTSHAFLKESKIIVNMYTQQNISHQRAVDYEAFYKCIHNLSGIIDENRKRGKIKLGLPYKISCGLAGGDWDIIRTMIDKVFEGLEQNVFIVRNLKYDPIKTS